MKPPREFAHAWRGGSCFGPSYPDGHSYECDQVTAAIEARDREVIEACIAVVSEHACPRKCEHKWCAVVRLRALASQGEP